MRLKIADIAAMLGIFVEEKHAQEEIFTVCRDTRHVIKGCLFVCIVGQNHDGHAFAAQAVEQGAQALLVARYLPHIPENIVQLVVPERFSHDTVRALGAIAHGWRKRFKGKVIGITGSAGKTTVKEVFADVLENAVSTPSGCPRVARSMLNYNNQIGLPLSLLATTGEEDFWVMEVGISQAHDMDELGSILQPDIALVLNAGAAHTEGLGVKGVAWHKSRLFAHVARGGVGVVSSDYAELVHAAENVARDVSVRLITFSGNTPSSARLKAAYMGVSSENATGAIEWGHYIVTQEEFSEPYTINAPFVGSYGAENVAAIAALAQAVGLDVTALQRGFARAVLPKQRFEVHTHGAWTLIDDSYNANPLSMRRMLTAAAERAQNKGKPWYAVLGAMGELGVDAESEHELLGRFLGTSGVQAVFWKGKHALAVQYGLKTENFTGAFIIVSSAHDFAHAWERAGFLPGIVVCKGSRSNALEVFVHMLREKFGAGTPALCARTQVAQTRCDAYVV